MRRGRTLFKSNASFWVGASATDGPPSRGFRCGPAPARAGERRKTKVPSPSAHKGAILQGSSDTQGKYDSGGCAGISRGSKSLQWHVGGPALPPSPPFLLSPPSVSTFPGLFCLRAKTFGGCGGWAMRRGRRLTVEGGRIARRLQFGAVHGRNSGGDLSRAGVRGLRW